MERTVVPNLSIWGLWSYGFLYLYLLSFPLNAVITSVVTVNLNENKLLKVISNLNKI